jgi:putative ABC transport system ATP-binding protein
MGLSLDNVSYRYKRGKVNVLKEISVEFEPGKLTSIVGPSGSGKTTLLSIMAGFDTPNQGSVMIDGKDLRILDLNKYRQEQIAMIFQAYQLFPLLTAIENVSYPLEFRGAPKKEARERAEVYLNSVGIDDQKFRRYPANLSGGEQQRVAIARSLSTGAKIILADEPTGNLDVANGLIVVDILRNLAHKEDYSVIIVTHNQEIAKASDIVYRMSDGVLSADLNLKD